MIKFGLIFLFSFFILPSFGFEVLISDNNLDVKVNYPDIVTQKNDFILSTMVKSKVDQISNITLTLSSPEVKISQNSFQINNLPKDSSLGKNFNMQIKSDAPNGKILANLSMEYFVKGFFDEKPVLNSFSKVVEFNVQSTPSITLDFNSPDSVFTGETFLVKGTIKNQGSEAQNIQIGIDSNQTNLNGSKIFSLTNLGAGEQKHFEFSLEIPTDVSIPTDITLKISTSYYDTNGKNYQLEDSVKVFSRHKGILEIGGAEGIWIGDFFIAPVVGVGTIVSSVIGFLIFLWHLKNKKKNKTKRK